MEKLKYEISGEQARPWLRYWAKSIDILIFIFILMFLFGFLGIDTEWSGMLPNIISNVVIYFLYIFFEAWLLSTWGTTIGKALFKIRVRNSDGTLLSYKEGVKRSFLVFYLGQGIGIPIFTIITGIMAYNKLQKNGITSWDKDGNYIVSHQILGKIRATLIIAFPIVIIVLFGIR